MQMYSNVLVFCRLERGTRSSYFVCLLTEFSCELLLIDFRKKLEIRKSRRLLLSKWHIIYSREIGEGLGHRFAAFESV